MIAITWSQASELKLAVFSGHDADVLLEDRKK